MKVEDRTMKTQRITSVIIAIAMSLTLAACGSAIAGSETQTDLTGSAEEVLEQILADLQDTGVHMPMALPPSEVTGDISQNAIGLSEQDFARLVNSAYSSSAAIATFAHQIIVIKAIDAASAVEIKKLVSGENGYDALKWICVRPDSAVVIESGEYVLIAASYNEVVDAVLGAFTAAAGNFGKTVKFFEQIDDGSDIGTGGGMGLLPIA